MFASDDFQNLQNNPTLGSATRGSTGSPYFFRNLTPNRNITDITDDTNIDVSTQETASLGTLKYFNLDTITSVDYSIRPGQLTIQQVWQWRAYLLKTIPDDKKIAPITQRIGNKHHCFSQIIGVFVEVRQNIGCKRSGHNSVGKSIV